MPQRRQFRRGGFAACRSPYPAPPRRIEVAEMAAIAADPADQLIAMRAEQPSTLPEMPAAAKRRSLSPADGQPASIHSRKADRRLPGALARFPRHAGKRNAAATWSASSTPCAASVTIDDDSRRLTTASTCADCFAAFRMVGRVIGIVDARQRRLCLAVSRFHTHAEPSQCLTGFCCHADPLHTLAGLSTHARAVPDADEASQFCGGDGDGTDRRDAATPVTGTLCAAPAVTVTLPTAPVAATPVTVVEIDPPATTETPPTAPAAATPVSGIFALPATVTLSTAPRRLPLPVTGTAIPSRR